MTGRRRRIAIMGATIARVAATRAATDDTTDEIELIGVKL